MPAFNPLDPAFLENPFPFYAMARRGAPVLQHEGSKFWSAFGYNDCVSILKDARAWSSYSPARGQSEEDQSMLGSDPPRHTRLRGLVSQAFTPRMVEQLEPRIRQVTNELLDGVIGQGRADMVETLTYPLPVIMIAEILGIPAQDRADFRRWSNDVVAVLGTNFGGGEPRELPQQVIDEMRAYFERQIDLRRKEPKSDLLSALVAVELEGGDRLSFDEMLQMLVLLLVAGNETTTNLIGNTLIELMAHPEQLARLRGDRSLVGTAIEEVLRYSSPVQATIRRATSGMEVGGKKIDADSAVIVWLQSANRDETAFDQPDIFDVSRTPNRHIAFGHGIHFCLGAPLARLEAKVALEVFLQRIGDFARRDNDLLPRVPTFIMRGVRSLPIEFSAA